MSAPTRRVGSLRRAEGWAQRGTKRVMPERAIPQSDLPLAIVTGSILVLTPNGLQSGGLMSEFFAQELLNSFFCLFCKALRVLDRVSVSNINWQDP
jgi:hypothetical protein